MNFTPMNMPASKPTIPAYVQPTDASGKYWATLRKKIAAGASLKTTQSRNYR